jgi:hypothetical protein
VKFTVQYMTRGQMVETTPFDSRREAQSLADFLNMANAYAGACVIEYA